MNPTRMEAILKKGGSGYFPASERGAGSDPRQAHLAEEDLPVAENRC